MPLKIRYKLFCRNCEVDVEPERMDDNRANVSCPQCGISWDLDRVLRMLEDEAIGDPVSNFSKVFPTRKPENDPRKYRKPFFTSPFGFR